jgi:hypothetical protein
MTNIRSGRKIMREFKRALPQFYYHFMGITVLLMSAMTAVAAPYRPANDAEVVDTLPKGSLTFQTRVSRQTNTKPTLSAIEPQVTALLAQSYAWGDPRALGQAESLMQPYRDDLSAQARLLRANIYQASHRFDLAKQELQAILKQTPNQPDSVLMLSSIDLVQGRFIEARRGCDQLNDRSVLILKMGCIAQVESMTGRLQQSAMTVQQLLQLNNGLSADQQQWLALMLADMALRLDDATLALTAFKQLNQSHNAPALSAKADWLLAHRQWAAVKQLLGAYSDNESLLIRLVVSELHLKDPRAQDNAKLLGQRIQVWNQRGEVAHQREQAQYALLFKDSAKALALARLNWQKQRETADVVVYVDAAIRHKSQQDIKTLQDWMKQTGFEYPVLSKALMAAGNAP